MKATMGLSIVSGFGALPLEIGISCSVPRIFSLTILTSGVVSAHSAERQRLQRAVV